MNAIRSIRKRLGETQAELALALGCTQGNVGHYETGQTVPPHVAARLIRHARSRDQVVTFEEIYGDPCADSEPNQAVTGTTCRLAATDSVASEDAHV